MVLYVHGGPSGVPLASKCETQHTSSESTNIAHKKHSYVQLSRRSQGLAGPRSIAAVDVLANFSWVGANLSWLLANFSWV